MSDNQLLRCSCHILFDEIDVGRQMHLLESHAPTIDTGGLGAAILPYLAAMSIDTLTVVNDNMVGLTSLQRQIVHTTESVGQPKVAPTQATIARPNPGMHVHAVQRQSNTGAIGACLGGASTVLDYSDNFGTRQATNLACVRAGVPLVSDAVIRFDGQINVFGSHAGGPCYACLFPPDKPASGVAYTAMGMLSPLVDMVGMVQTTEILKLITDIGSSLAGRPLMLNGLTIEWVTMRIAQQPSCPVYGSMHLRAGAHAAKKEAKTFFLLVADEPCSPSGSVCNCRQF